MTTAAFFFHRFYMRRAFLPHGVRQTPNAFSLQEVAPACFWLACKVEESHRRTHSIVEAAMGANDKSPQGRAAYERQEYKVNPESREYVLWREKICYCETALLEALCFDLIIPSPHACLVRACKALNVPVDLVKVANERLTST